MKKFSAKILFWKILVIFLNFAPSIGFTHSIIIFKNISLDSIFLNYMLMIFHNANFALKWKDKISNRKYSPQFLFKNNSHTCFMWHGNNTKIRARKNETCWDSWVSYIHMFGYAWVEYEEWMKRRFNKTWHKLMWHHVIAFNLIFFLALLSNMNVHACPFLSYTCGCIQNCMEHKREIN